MANGTENIRIIANWFLFFSYLKVKKKSSMTLLFYYLAPLQNDTDVTSRCMQFILGDKGETNVEIQICMTDRYRGTKVKGRIQLLQIAQDPHLTVTYNFNFNRFMLPVSYSM